MVRVVVAVLGASVAAAESDLPPSLQMLMDLSETNPEDAANLIAASPIAAIVREIAEPANQTVSGTYVPTVVAHGMGDSCFNKGMKSITNGIGNKTSEYSVCYGTANNVIFDTIDGFLKNMDKSVDFFADKVRNDPKLANGFNCVGFSQGNSLCRGYIQKYNDPPVNAFLSVHGTVMGVSAFPSCFTQGKSLGLVCKALAEVLADAAYSKLVQGILFQADYYRHNVGPKATRYLENSQLAAWNNENPSKVDASIKENFAKTNKFAMVKALKDSMVFPNENEHWGAMDDVPNGDKILAMRDTKFYKEDLFGLKTADEAGKIFFETTPGGHLSFTDEELYGWVEKYLQVSSQVAV